MMPKHMQDGGWGGGGGGGGWEVYVVIVTLLLSWNLYDMTSQSSYITSTVVHVSIYFWLICG